MNIYQNVYLTQLLRKPMDVKTSSNGNLMYRDLYSLLTKFIWLTIKESLTLTDEGLSSMVRASSGRILLLPAVTASLFTGP